MTHTVRVRVLSDDDDDIYIEGSCIPNGAAMLYPLMPTISGARVRLQYLAAARSRDTDSPMKA